jgi:hypothetical protein
MKKLFVIIISLMVLSACTTSKEARTTRAEQRKGKKLTDQTQIKIAVESKKYILKFDRVYSSFGRRVDLIPRANYLIIDRDRAVLNTAYMGRQFDIRPIAAINIHGRASNYNVTDNTSKGSYEISMKVDNGGPNTFSVNISISRNGYCSASVSSLKIDNVRYEGYLVPIIDKDNSSSQAGNPI